jgi:hypothetical protein
MQVEEHGHQTIFHFLEGDRDTGELLDESITVMGHLTKEEIVERWKIILVGYRWKREIQRIYPHSPLVPCYDEF